MDLQYPEKIHDIDNDYPLAPDYCLKIANADNISTGTVKKIANADNISTGTVKKNSTKFNEQI